MKYFVLVPDGAADRPNENGDTALSIADISHINGVAKRGQVGLVQTIPEGIKPGSDAANLAVLGYDPRTDLTGRSPLEAVSMGVSMADKDVSFRTNLVTLSGDGDYEDLRIIDHSSGDITSAEAKVLIEYIDEKLGGGDPANEGRLHFYSGVSYRHALIVSDGARTESGVGDVFSDYTDYRLTPPHDILEKRIGDYLPAESSEAYILALMKRSYELLKDHPVNLDRIKRGLNPANSIWIWGEGIRPRFSKMSEKYDITGSAISAVDLVKGIGILAGLDAVYVEGATGTLETDFGAKGLAAIKEFDKGKDFVFVHVEAPDECSHQGSTRDKILALELIDREIFAPVLYYLQEKKREAGEDYKILVLPDHRTPVEIRTHSSEPVPYVLFDSRIESMNEENAFTERSAETGRGFSSGAELADCFFSKG
ncbi:MAG: cofactor-independent phosphoglycerate mutase [Clostridiales Family XIII bacterium]|jgi:2,3-bisphosphoglycerate-independent phosphoglycerate mutase|nr:cofactor-independent phosphoglycerate mutase [Clostridiales Family XIII bacterium]